MSAITVWRTTETVRMWAITLPKVKLTGGVQSAPTGGDQTHQRPHREVASAGDSPTPLPSGRS